jgi:type III secretion protein J
MGQIFRKEGLVSSPLEERARYIYALSQELTNTLSQMDGVLAARVHVVLPERGGVGENTTPSTAAVFIKHQAGYNLDALQPQIRKLVTHAIPGLTEDRVSIALVSAQPAAGQPAGGAMRQVLGIEVADGSSGVLTAWLAALALLVLALAGAVGWLLWRYGAPVRAKAERREPAGEVR